VIPQVVAALPALMAIIVTIKVDEGEKLKVIVAYKNQGEIQTRYTQQQRGIDIEQKMTSSPPKTRNSEGEV
jgi:hypothetical protein